MVQVYTPLALSAEMVDVGRFKRVVTGRTDPDAYRASVVWVERLRLTRYTDRLGLSRCTERVQLARETSRLMLTRYADRLSMGML